MASYEDANKTTSKDESIVRIAGQNDELCAVELIGGKNRLLTDSIVTVEELFGRDPQATTYFFIGSQYDVSAITLNDTVRVQIVAGPDATLFPAIDVTTIATADVIAESNKEVALADKIVQTLNNDSTFSLQWKAQRIKDFSGVFIASRLFNEWGERKTAGDFSVTTTGTVTVTLGYNTVERRGYSTELARSPNDPRQGILSIAGTVFAVPGGAGDLFIRNALNGGSPDLRVNGSVVPVTFSITAHPTKTIYVNEMRFYGGANSLKFEQFLGKNTPLTIGVSIQIKSDNQTITLPSIKTTEDFKNKFCIGNPQNFRIDIQPGANQVLASFVPNFTINLKKQGTFGSGNDDYIKVIINDNLSTGMSELAFLAAGFTKEE